MRSKTFLFIILQCLAQIHSQTTLSSNSDDAKCSFDLELSRKIIYYKTIVDYIMNVITTKPISEDFYEKYTHFLDDFGSRPSGSDILERAIDFIKELTFKSGVDDVTTEDVLVPQWHRDYEAIRMILPRHKIIAVLGLGFSVATPPDGITTEVIVVNSFEEFAEIEKELVLGKIVLFNAPFTTYMDTVKYRISSASIAAEKGASAVLVRSITPFSLYTPHTGALVYKKNVTKIPAAAITVEDADLIERIYNRGEKVVLNMKLFNSYDLKMSRNTIIDLKGKEEPEKIVIVSGHMDSWDVGQGAIDDGGGMMISWFVPVILNYLNLRPRRTIRAILWTSEELGLNGGKAYLKRHADELKNIDYVLESDEGTFKPLGLKAAGSPAANCLIEKILRLFSPIDGLQIVNSTGSELSLFIAKGIPGASLWNQDDRYFWYHHTEADTIKAQNMTNVLECAAFWAAISYVIADLPIDIPRKN